MLCYLELRLKDDGPGSDFLIPCLFSKKETRRSLIQCSRIALNSFQNLSFLRASNSYSLFTYLDRVKRLSSMASSTVSQAPASSIAPQSASTKAAQ